MLRITKKERKALYYTNTRLRKKQNNLKNTYNINANFKIKTPSQFKTRAELNKYKQEAKSFLAPYTHKYVKGGRKHGSTYYYAIPYNEYQRLKKHVARQNRVAERLMNKASQIKLQTYGRTEEESVAEFIYRQRAQYEKDQKKKLGGRLQQFFKIKLDPNRIYSDQSLEEFSYAILNFNTKEYYDKKNKLAQVNMEQALFNTFGSIAEPIVKLIDELTPEEFGLLFESEPAIDFDFVYSPEFAFRVLQDFAKGLLNFIGNTHLKNNLTDEFSDLTNDVYKMTDLDSNTILNSYYFHDRVFEFNNRYYYGVFNTKEIMDIKFGRNLEKLASKKSVVELSGEASVLEARKEYYDRIKRSA